MRAGSPAVLPRPLRRLDAFRVAYAGNHGLELDTGDGRRVHPLAEAAEPVVSRLAADLRARLSPVEGAFVEEKSVSLTVHYRRATIDASEVRSTVEAAVERVPEGTVRMGDGKQIWELRPDFPWDKGHAVRLLAREAGSEWFPVYVGDDTTDEDAFHAVAEPDGIAVHVGHADTVADYRVPDPAGATALLEHLRDALDDGG